MSSKSNVLVFSTGGERAAVELKNKRSHGLTPDGRERALSEYAATGYGYADYVGTPGYGMTLTSPDRVRTQLKELGGWREVYFGAAGWNNHQDVFGVVKET